MAYVTVYTSESTNIEVSGVTGMTFIDNESHGTGPVGTLPLPQGGKRLIVAAPNVVAVLIEEDE